MFNVIIAFLFLTLLFTKSLLAANWYYPLEKTEERESLKAFGQYIDKEFYRTSPDVFPTKFTGYHAGTDWELLPGEEEAEVPVIAVASGRIVYSGIISGYGGVILQKLGKEPLTAIYGHLQPSSMPGYGTDVPAGEKIALLGDGFSEETDGERKHLHFGIYKGEDIYFKGYEANKAMLENKWINPLTRLRSYNAQSIRSVDTANNGKVPVYQQPTSPPPADTEPANILPYLISLFSRLFESMGR